MLSGAGISDTELRHIEFIYIHYLNKCRKGETGEDCVQTAEQENIEDGLATRLVLFVKCVN